MKRLLLASLLLCGCSGGTVDPYNVSGDWDITYWDGSLWQGAIHMTLEDNGGTITGALNYVPDTVTGTRLGSDITLVIDNQLMGYTMYVTDGWVNEPNEAIAADWTDGGSLSGAWYANRP